LADKTKTIKSASDKELDELIIRLRKESELQGLIAEINRKSGSGYIPYDYGQEISTEKPIESLYHYGVLGMHWGRHRARISSAKEKLLSKKPGSDDYELSRQLKTKGSRNLSNKELRDLTQRLQLEKQLKELSPKKYQKGMNVAKGIIAVGTTASSLYALSNSPLAKHITSAAKKAAAQRSAIEYMI